MNRRNTSDFIGHPLPKDSDPHMGPPTTPGAPTSEIRRWSSQNLQRGYGLVLRKFTSLVNVGLFVKPRNFAENCSHAVLKKYWISKSVFKTLKEYWIWPKCTWSIEILYGKEM